MSHFEQADSSLGKPILRASSCQFAANGLYGGRLWSILEAGATPSVADIDEALQELATAMPEHDIIVSAPSSSAALTTVRERIAAACREAGRKPDSVTLVAVTKTYGAETIIPVIAAGQRVFGENRVQEAKAKWPELREQNPGIELHLIGPLQSNKAREAVALFDAIHVLDRTSLAAALTKEMERQGRRPLLFVQVNIGSEPQKSGIAAEQADAFIKECREIHGLDIGGLMCIPPADESPAPFFALTAKIARRNGLNLLSMGMSADFEMAIRFGATHVRVGSAIFGARPAKA